MSIVARLTAEYFKRDQSGRTIVYPFGPWGLGYFVPDVVTEQRIRLKLVLGFIAIVISSIAVADALPSFLTRDLTADAEALIVWLVAVTMLQICYMGWLKLLARGMDPAAERMRLAQSIVAQVWPRWLLRSLLYGQVVGMICAGIVIILIPSSMGLTLILSIAFSQRFLTSNPHHRGSSRVVRQLLSVPLAHARNTLALLPSPASQCDELPPPH
jgi:hypothetical protein